MADKTNVFIDISVKQTLSNHVQSADGDELVYLCAGITDGGLHIVSCIACTTLTNLPNSECYCLPQGIQVCGVFSSISKSTKLDLSRAQNLVKNLPSIQEVPSHRNNEPLVIWQHCASSGDDNGYLYNPVTASITKCDLTFSNIAAAFVESRITFRIQTSFEICVEYNNQEALRHQFELLCKNLQCPCTTFLIKDCNMLLHYDNSQTDPDQTCQDLLNRMAAVCQGDILSPANRKAKPKKTSFKINEKTQIKDAIDVNLLTKLSDNTHTKNGFVPVIYYQEDASKYVTITFPIDVVVMATIASPVAALPRMFTLAIYRQLQQTELIMHRFSEGASWCVPRPYHFKPPGFLHIVTFVYPEITSEGVQADDICTEPYRIKLHKQLLLPVNRPLLRVCNAFTFNKDTNPEAYLINPHSAISSSAVSNDCVGLVDGRYSYHHYMQDNFNDDKWGCAYRSLQTICSWFRHQGYTSTQVPSHRQIQQALVDLGDKKTNFAGSKQWIGSFEVSMCLEHLLGVTSKIMFVNSGAELASKGRELLHHFNSQGTPIMIGGGVLAHTIIGVDFNKTTGDIKFLILDPHYTGSEDLKTILDKGWCGWKGPNFWNQQAHYNMCMPQRPEMI